MLREKILAISGVVAITGSVLGGGAIAASAQEPSGGSTTSILAQAAPSDDRAVVMDAFIARLAANLGIDVTALESALQSTGLQVIADRLAAGTITQAQADDASARVQAGDFFAFGGGRGPGGPGGPGGRHGGGPGLHIESAALASFLGVDVTTLQTALSSGSTLAQLAESNGVARDALKSFLAGAQATNLAAKVAAGDITQARADEELAEFNREIDAIIDSTRPGHKASRLDGPRPGDDATPAAPAS